MSQPTIDLQCVRKTYRRGGVETVVLDGVDLAVEAGESLFLVGPSGSGKTTLLSILGCMLAVDGGEVSILGQRLQALNGREAAMFRRDRIGFVFQRFHLIRGLSAVENVATPLVLQGQRLAAARHEALQKLREVGLADFADASPAKLSVGQCQRVAVARALAGNPDLVLADEPTAALDAETGQTAMELLRRLTVETGKTLVVVTHDPRTLCYADRILEVRSGQLLASAA